MGKNKFVSMKTIIILTDSVALPRKHNKGIVSWEQTYIYRLKKHLKDYEIINLSIGGGSLKDIRNQVNYYKVLNPICVIIQCGIVDAAPRAFSRLEMDIIKKFKLFRLTKPWVSFLRKYRSVHYVNPTEFKQLLKQIKNEFNNTYFFTIGIIPSSLDYEKQLPNVTKSIDTYNAILATYSNFISLEEIPRDGILEDHHHINGLGHDFIYNKILEKFIKCGIK